MTAPVPRFLSFGDAALLVEFGQTVCPEVNAVVMALDAAMMAAPPEGLVETAPGFRSLLVAFDPLATDGEAMEAPIAGLLAGLSGTPPEGRHWVLPAAYEGDLAPDLADVAARTGLSADEVVARHTGAEHTVSMIGFLPGCPYMTGLDAALDLPRRTDPRLKVPRGAVAIAVGQTVIYPVESPGGWNLIGSTPVALFDPAREAPALLAPGDRVRFRPVPAAEHGEIARAAAAGEWDPAREALRGAAP